MRGQGIRGNSLRRRVTSAAIGTLALCTSAWQFPRAAAPAPSYAVEEKSIGELQHDLRAGRVTSEELVEAYLSRIDAIDRHGPSLKSVLSINPHALRDARSRDAQRKMAKATGPLFGIPILVKDNIETADSMATTAGSFALKNNVTLRDSPSIARLRAAGAIILGKANLSEWAGMRSVDEPPGWSAVGGLTRNPYAIDRSACGSSAGSAVATAASFAAAAVGTETDGSIVCPASVSGIVGLKPTVGLIERTRIIPISSVQDTPGPMGRTVADAAALLTIMAAPRSGKVSTDLSRPGNDDYSRALNLDALKNLRVGIARFAQGENPAVRALLKDAVATLRAQGAVLVEIQDPPGKAEDIGANEWLATISELKAGLDTYLATTAPAVNTRSLAQVIAFNEAYASEMALFGQEWFHQAEAAPGLTNSTYRAARSTATRLAGPEGLMRLMTAHQLDVLIAPTTGPTWLANGKQPETEVDMGSIAMFPAVAGYPHITVPMGQVQGLPVGLSFIGPPWSEARLIGAAFAYEQHSQKRRAPTYAQTTH